MRSALAGRSEIEPGDILWVRGGLYLLDATLECSLGGTEGRTVEVRGDPLDERPVLEFTGPGGSAALKVSGEYVSLRRLESKSSDGAHKTSTAGDAGDPRRSGLLVESGLGVRLIDLWVHDFGAALFESRPSGLEIYGCLFSTAIGQDYIHRIPWARRGNGFARHGFGSPSFANVDVVGNAFFNNGIADNEFHRN